jgi:hypothetical protein
MRGVMLIYAIFVYTQLNNARLVLCGSIYLKVQNEQDFFPEIITVSCLNERTCFRRITW